MKETFICPHSSKPLRLLGEEEMLSLNKRIEAGGLFFQKGAPLLFKLEKAYVSQSQTYIYPEIDGILLLQKQTAIVVKNRTENPYRRTPEEDIANFHRELGLSHEGNFSNKQYEASEELIPDSNEKQILKNTLPKSGNCMVSLGSGRADAIHNLVFSTDFRNYIHLDHDICRLRHVASELKQGTQCVLTDPNFVPLSPDSINALYSFEFVNDCTKEEQKPLYTSLMNALSPDSRSVILHSDSLTLQSCYKNEQLSKKAKGILTPWKKNTIPEMIFHRVAATSGTKSDAFSGKRSLGSQFSG